MSRPNVVTLHGLCVPPTDKMTKKLCKQALKFAWRSTLFHAMSVFVHPVVCVKRYLRSFFVRKQALYMRPQVMLWKAAGQREPPPEARDIWRTQFGWEVANGGAVMPALAIQAVAPVN